jgi:hypothetical protein
MVRLNLQDFAEATQRMVQISGLRRTRLMVKLRPGDHKIILKSTDDRTTLTSKALTREDLKVVERVIADYVNRATRSAPAEPWVGEKEEKKMAKKKRGKK